MILITNSYRIKKFSVKNSFYLLFYHIFKKFANSFSHGVELLLLQIIMVKSNAIQVGYGTLVHLVRSTPHSKIASLFQITSPSQTSRCHPCQPSISIPVNAYLILQAILVLISLNPNYTIIEKQFKMS